MYRLCVIDRKTKKIVQEETRKTKKAADRLYERALKNVNQLKYKLQFEELDSNLTVNSKRRRYEDNRA